MRAGILVIDDHEDNIAVIDYLLRANGYSPLLARSGAEGLRLAAEGTPPDLILLDIRMPEMDGYQVVAALKRQPAFKKTRVVAVTASAMVGDRERIDAAGFDGYIQKPIDPETFLDLIRPFLDETSTTPDGGER